MRSLRHGLLAALLLVSVAGAQVPLPYDITVREDADGVLVSIGDLRERPIPATIATAVGFLVDWRRGRLPSTLPVTVGGIAHPLGSVTLGLPIRGLTLLAETDTSALVGFGAVTVHTPAGSLTGPGTLALRRDAPDARWQVASVEVR